MKTRVLALVLAIGFVGFSGIFIWAAVRTADPGGAIRAEDSASAEISELLSDGRIEIQVYALGNREARLEIRFTPDTKEIEAPGLRPDVKVAMAGMHVNGFEPPLQQVESGVWRAQFELPMEGRWLVTAGFGEDLAEVEFDAK